MKNEYRLILERNILRFFQSRVRSILFICLCFIAIWDFPKFIGVSNGSSILFHIAALFCCANLGILILRITYRGLKFHHFENEISAVEYLFERKKNSEAVRQFIILLKNIVMNKEVFLDLELYSYHFHERFSLLAEKFQETHACVIEKTEILHAAVLVKKCILYLGMKNEPYQVAMLNSLEKILQKIITNDIEPNRWFYSQNSKQEHFLSYYNSLLFSYDWLVLDPYEVLNKIEGYFQKMSPEGLVEALSTGLGDKVIIDLIVKCLREKGTEVSITIINHPT